MSEPTKCPQCGGELSANFPPGVCPACLLKQGLSPSTLTGAAEDASSRSGSNPRRSWTPPTPAELSPKFSQLEIVELLGQGGMGAVYKVRQRDLDRWAALKILPSDVANDPNFAERFQREARALAQLGHQHIVIVYEFGQREGVYFLLMEYIDGVTLRQASQAGQITAKDALGIVTQICDALQFAHEEGVVHRDIKPENILIDKRGRVKIADFGLAKLLGKQASFPTLTGTHQIMGTPAYMAPEQMEGTKGVDHRADIFSLGVVFYELLTGELPLGRFAPPSQKYSLDVRLDEVVLRTLEKEPDRRYQQASDVKLDVEMIRSKPIAAGTTKTVKPRRSWSVGKNIVRTLIIAMGTFSGLVGTVFFISWLDQQSRPSEAHRDPIPSASPQDPIQLYMTEVQRQKQEQERQKQLEEAARDPYETNALVQFTTDGVKLHPHAFGTDELTAEQRVTVEKILTDIHREYLKAEAAHSESTTEDGVQTVTIRPFAEDLVKLENALWTAVDTQLPVAVQKILRQRLPLFADPTVPLPQVATSDMMMGGGSAGGPAAMPSSFGGSGMSAPPGVGGFGGMGVIGSTSNLRYQQLLGWKQDHFPLRITIYRRGKWFRWEIATPTLRSYAAPGSFGGSIKQPTGEYSKLDTGEAPELPSGLRRFWMNVDLVSNNSPEGTFQRAKQAFASRNWQKLADCLTEEARNESSFEHLIGALTVYVLTEFAIDSGAKQTQEALNANSRFKQFVQSIEKTYPQASLLTGEAKAKIKAITEKLMENRYSRAERRAISAQFIRETFGDQSQDFFVRATEFFHSTNPEVGGFDDLKLDSTEDNGAFGTYAVRGAAKRQPIWFSRKDPGSEWMIDGLVDVSILNQSVVSNVKAGLPVPDSKDAADSQPPDDQSLSEQLLKMDRLRAADQTPWEEVEKLTNELLAKYTAPADKGRIHWMATHVYGQSDIRGHGADVIRHAQEALKYERDPVQRGWLYMYLGDATGLLQKRDEATRWYLKGYFELLAFNLPEKAPELPTVGKFRSVIAKPADVEADHNQIVFEVLQAAEVKARKEAELVRDLVSRRGVYIGQLQNLYGRQHVEGSDASVALRNLATEILRDETVVGELLNRVWPDLAPVQPTQSETAI